MNTLLKILSKPFPETSVAGWRRAFVRIMSSRGSRGVGNNAPPPPLPTMTPATTVAAAMKTAAAAGDKKTPDVATAAVTRSGACSSPTCSSSTPASAAPQPPRRWVVTPVSSNGKMKEDFPLFQALLMPSLVHEHGQGAGARRASSVIVAQPPSRVRCPPCLTRPSALHRRLLCHLRHQRR